MGSFFHVILLNFSLAEKLKACDYLNLGKKLLRSLFGIVSLMITRYNKNVRDHIKLQFHMD